MAPATPPAVQTLMRRLLAPSMLLPTANANATGNGAVAGSSTMHAAACPLPSLAAAMLAAAPVVLTGTSRRNRVLTLEEVQSMGEVLSLRQEVRSLYMRREQLEQRNATLLRLNAEEDRKLRVLHGAVARGYQLSERAMQYKEGAGDLRDQAGKYRDFVLDAVHDAAVGTNVPVVNVPLGPQALSAQPPSSAANAVGNAAAAGTVPRLVLSPTMVPVRTRMALTTCPGKRRLATTMRVATRLRSWCAALATTPPGFCGTILRCAPNDALVCSAHPMRSRCAQHFSTLLL